MSGWRCATADDVRQVRDIGAGEDTEPGAKIIPKADAELAAGLGEAEESVAAVATSVAAGAAADVTLGNLAADVVFRAIGVQRDLKQLGADRLVLPDLPLVGLQYFARRMTARKPAALARVKDPHRTIEVACFLRLTLLLVTDAGLTLLDHQIAALWRGARERAEAARVSRLRRFRQLLGDLAGLAGDEALDAGALRSRLRGLIAPFAAEREATQVAAIRHELGQRSRELARLLKAARAVALIVPADHRLAAAFATLDALDASSGSTLPSGIAQPFGPSWQGLIDQSDRAAALGCFRAATLMALKRAVRNRSASVDHSLSHRAAEDKLIPLSLWLKLTRFGGASQAFAGGFSDAQDPSAVFA